MLFPIVTSNFSALGVAVERYRAIVKLHRAVNLQRLVSVVWTLVSWFIALFFVIVLWGHTRLFTIQINEDNTFYWQDNNENKDSR